jgi:hypothetical protein
MARVAEPEAIMNRLGLTAPMLAKIGAIAVLAGNIEYETETTIWALEGHDPAGKRHSMDGGRIRDGIKALADMSSSLPPGDFKNLVATWCQAAEPAFKCRNSIFHGVTLGGDRERVSFLKNPRWQGEIRKRELPRFHAGEHTLALMEQVFAVLYRVIVTIDRLVRHTDMEVSHNTAQTLLSALREARSVSSELEDLAAAVSHERS